MAVDLRLRGMSPVTQRMYLGCAQRFATYRHQAPTALGEADVRTCLDHLVRERRIGRAALGVYVAALHFLSRVTPDRPDVMQRIRYPRRGSERLPAILRPTEVERLLAAVRALKHRAMVMVASGAGLRASELCTLTAADIDSERMLIRGHRSTGQNRPAESATSGPSSWLPHAIGCGQAVAAPGSAERQKPHGCVRRVSRPATAATCP